MNNSESEKCDLDESMNSLDNETKYKPEDIKRNKMIHNILEKNRRAHLKDCFENLQAELPNYKEKKVTNLLILKQTIKYLEVSLFVLFCNLVIYTKDFTFYYLKK